MVFWGGWIPRSVEPTDVTGLVTDSLDYVNTVAGNVQTLITNFKFWDTDLAIPSIVLPGVSWETIDANAINSYIESLKSGFTYAPTIPTFPTVDPPEINLPDITEVRDDTLIDTIATKLKNNILNDGYGLETTDADGIAERSLARASMLSAAQTGSILAHLTSGGISLPAQAASALSSANIALEYNRAVLESDRAVLLGSNAAYMSDYNATRGSGIKLAAMLLEEYVKNLEAVIFAIETQVEAYAKKIEAQTMIIKVEYEHYSARVKAFAAMVDAASKVADLAIKNMDTTNSIYKERIQLAVDHFKTAIMKLIGLDGIFLESGEKQLSSLAAIGAAALSQYNASASIAETYSASTTNASHESAGDAAHVSARQTASNELIINADEFKEFSTPQLPSH